MKYSKKFQEKKRLFFGAFCLAMIILTGCNVVELIEPDPTASPKPEWLTEFLENPTCQQPCWENIIPGETNIWEVDEILSKIPEVTNIQGPKEAFQGDEWHVTWDYSDGTSGGRIVSDENGIVNEISLTINRSYALYLDEVISIFPFSQIWVSDCQSDIFGTYCIVDIFLQESDMILSLDNTQSPPFKKTINITSDAKISSISLFPKNYLENYYPVPKGIPREDWHGFGEYENPWKR